MRKNGSVNLDLAKGKVVESANSNLFCQKFVKQVEKFLEHFQLLPSSRRVLVGVSGGIDSMSLLFTLYLLKSRACITDIKVIYINHDTRKHTEDEERFIRAVSETLGLTFFSEKVTGLNLKMSNFEAAARGKRYQVFKKYLERFPDTYLCLGHHINDSYEWSFMMSKKSGNLSATLGIPVKNGKIIRPFLSVSKRQILIFAKHLKIPFMRDSSNEDKKFERNFVRLELLPLINEKYPQFLKNYVYQSNDLAFRLNRHRIQKILPPAKLIHRYFKGVVFLYRADLLKELAGSELEVMHIIKKLSNKQRGILRKEIEKLFSAFKAGKKGPMSFSGAVQCYMVGPFLMFINSEGKEWLIEKDNELVKKIAEQKFNGNQQNLCSVMNSIQKTQSESLPLVALNGPSKNSKNSSTLEHFFPKTTRLLKENFTENYFWILENAKMKVRQNDTKIFTILTIS